MQSRLLSTCAVFLLATLMATSATAGNLDALMARAMKGTRTPALGVLVIRDGKIADMAVRGVRRSDRADRIKPNDTWLLGSTGKPITVALIAKLVERGTLSWQAPLASMLPELAGSMRPEYRSVTLVQLLSHRAGLPENIVDLKLLDPYFADTRPLPVQRLAYIGQALQDAPINAPNSEFAYSNTGFLIAAAIAERATGKSFETLMQQEVFTPLDMHSAGFGPTGNGQPRGHRGGKPVLAMHQADDGVPLMFAPAGNLHMNLHDWAVFCIDQLAGSNGAGKLLKPESYRLMQTAQPNSPAGVDWGVQDSIAGRQGPVLAHGGSDGNWLAWVALFPKTGNGVLTVANATEDMGGDKATHAVLAGLFPTLSPAMAPVKASH
jgi:CubicO group peptidase (beta-lactamase class C family)